jgi:MFS family permease
MLEQTKPLSKLATTKTGVGRWHTVAVLFLALLISFADRLVINLVVDPIRSELALSDLKVSLLQGAGFAVFFALAGLPAGRLADRANRPKLIVLGLILWSTGAVICGIADSFSIFLTGRVAVGLGEAALVPAASSLIIDLFSGERRGLALGTFSLGATFGTGTALFGGGVLLNGIEAGWFETIPLLATLSPWRQLFLVTAFPGFVLVPLLLAVREPSRKHRGDHPPFGTVVRRLLADDGTVLRVCLVKGALAAGDYGLISWLPTLLQRRYALSALEAGTMVGAAITASGILASIMGGGLSDQLVRRWGTSARSGALLPCYSLTIMGAIATLMAEDGVIATAAFGIWALGSIAGYVIGHVVMQENVPDEMRATTVAFSLAATALLGIGLGPTLVPLVARAFGPGGDSLQNAMGTVALMSALLAFFIIWPVVRRSLRPRSG